MMAIIGFVALLIIGGYCTLTGLVILYSAIFGFGAYAPALVGLAITAAGGWLLWWSMTNGPIGIVVRVPL